VGLRHVAPPRDAEPLLPPEAAQPAESGVLSVSPDGRWAVTHEGRGWWLEDGEGGARIRLGRGGPDAYDLYWLPAVE